MAAFINKAGAPVLPVLDAEGNLPVSVSENGTDMIGILADLLLEMRAARIGLEILNDMERGDLLLLAQDSI